MGREVGSIRGKLGSAALGAALLCALVPLSAGARPKPALPAAALSPAPAASPTAAPASCPSYGAQSVPDSAVLAPGQYIALLVNGQPVPGNCGALRIDDDGWVDVAGKGRIHVGGITLRRALTNAQYAVHGAFGFPGSAVSLTPVSLGLAAAPPAAPRQTPAAGPVVYRTPAPAARSGVLVIRPDDQLSVTTYDEPTFSTGSNATSAPLRVLPNGNISMPLIGDVHVGGETTTEAGDTIAQKLKKYLRDPRVTVAIVAIGQVEALVLGDVKLPGKYLLQPPARLTDAIAAAGGLGITDGDFPVARLQEADGSQHDVPLQKLLHDGDAALNEPLSSGETVYIPSPTLVTVEVLGAVEKQGDVQVREGEDVAMAVARAGASTQQAADLNHVTVTRQSGNGPKTVMTVNLYDILKKGDTRRDIVMQKGDLVYVPASPKHDAFGAASNLLYPLSALLRF